jgi:aryl-alcohol dehydrogenase-like predicted oxidoreductase
MPKLRATKEGTENFCGRFPVLMHKRLGKTGLTVSACGFGSYRVDYRVAEHFEAMEYALGSGINLIDTSSNYSDGGSEILIGKALQKFNREEIVIVSKGGYIQGKNYETAQKRKGEGNPYPEVVEYSRGLWHSTHPEFLKDQIALSLERMELETIDVYLLHNPEYFLDSPGAKNLNPDELIHEYYRRIKNAFEYLETEVDKGRIACYGISSNSFVKESDDPTFTSLEECVNAANEIKNDNHFYVIQFPLNLYETGAVSIKNQAGDTKTLVQYVGEKNLGTLVNRPLNAITQRSLFRLADFDVKNEFLTVDETQVIAEINLLDSMEEDFLKENLESLQLSGQNQEAIQYFLKAGQILRENWKNFGSIESFNDVKKQFLIPRVNYAFSVMVGSPSITDEAKDKLDRIAKQINKLIGIIETIYGVQGNMRSKNLHLKLNTLVGQNEIDSFKELTLSQKAILMINSIDEVSCTLVGMRQKKYVDDVIGSLKAKKIENAAETLRSLQDAETNSA